MKVFVVTTDRDGDTTKVPGRTETEVIRTERRFAAEIIDDVWNAAPIFVTSDEEIVAIYEEHPAIIILGERGDE